MNKIEKIRGINIALAEFFSQESNPQRLQAKDLMPLFVEKGIFKNDHKNGLPIRKLLRELDESNNLSAIPYVIPERKAQNTNWHFANTNNTQTAILHTQEIKKEQKQHSRENSDEFYVINLCNEVLGRTALQQHKFDFLRGDSGRHLPVDAYYEDLRLVIEYCESQHRTSTPFFDRKMTVSGVTRGEQRKKYDERRIAVLPQHGIRLIHIHHTDFGTTKRIHRNYERDLEIVKQKLYEFI